jgi:hypothetical protein
MDYRVDIFADKEYDNQVLAVVAELAYALD